MIAQCGKYLDLLQPGTELETLVTAHNESMQLVESESATDLVGEDASVSLYKVCEARPTRMRTFFMHNKAASIVGLFYESKLTSGS